MKKEFIAILTAALSIGVLNAAEPTAAPESAPQANGLYDWAGKFKVNSDNEINLDMPHEDLRNWKFYFNLKKSGKDIQIDDYAQGVSYKFVHESKAKKSFIPGF